MYMAKRLSTCNEETKEETQMAKGHMELLFNDRLAPITTSMGFIEEECSRVANKFMEWCKEIKKFDHFTRRITSRAASGDLDQMLQSLLPLKMVQATRFIFMPTTGGWTAFFDNGYRGTDPTAISHLPELLHSRSVWVVAEPHTLRREGTTLHGRQGALLMEVYGHEKMEWLNLIRKIRLENNMGKWQFDTSGEPFPFEETERYQATRRIDRFDFDMLKRYLKALGLSPFEEDFYLPSYDRRGVLVEISTKNPDRNKDILLEEARRLNRIDD
jgi:hypothetical protein